MNNLAISIFIGILLEEDENRNHMRLLRRNIRDEMNAFEIPDVHFKQMFRLDKASTVNLITALKVHANPGGKIPLHLKILATLHFTGTGCYQNPVGSNLWIALSQSSISRAINEICALITDNLLPIWVKFPTTEADKNIAKQGFFQNWGFRDVVGVIDGTHVEIISPSVTDEMYPPFVYINRKGRYSINVMLICDSSAKIVGCSARYPGSVDDADIWQMSDVRRHLEIQYEAGDKLSHLIGDSGYPLEPWLFTPFHNPVEGSQEANFNHQLSSVRNVIERTNGILKGRFRCLSRHRILNYHPIKAANIIYTCCVLHNIAANANITIPECDIEYREIVGQFPNDNGILEAVVEQDMHLGRQARETYIRNNIGINR